MAFEGCEKEVMVCSWPLRKDGEQMRQTWLLKRRVKINCERCDVVLAGGRVSEGQSLWGSQFVGWDYLEVDGSCEINWSKRTG